MVIQTKPVFMYVLHWNIIIVFLHLDELGPCVYIKLKKYVSGPWFSWNLVNIFLTYMDSFDVEMVSWQRPHRVNFFPKFIYSWK